MRYSENTIEQIRQANDIVEVIGQRVKLTRKGANYFGLCPFHGEKTASFSVSPGKQIYYCFGCGAGGTVINFLMEYENYTFTEALSALAERAHIELPADNGGAYSSRGRERQELLDIHKDAALYYFERLHLDTDKSGLDYFRNKRHLSDRTITHFGLGYTGKGSSELYKHLRSKGYSDSLISASGLAVIEERSVHDRFFNRIMFPIMDTGNHVIAFGGRVTGDAKPKYLNSPESVIFDKSSTLYGLNFARKSRKPYMLLCEGYMDVISLHQAGFINSVASLGTAFNEKHARLLKRYCDTVVLTQDSDEAGTNAKLKAYPILRDAGLNVKVADLEGIKDPDEYIRINGCEAFEKRIGSARNGFLWSVDIIKSRYDLTDPAERTRYYDEIVRRLCEFSEPLERNNYVSAVSEAQHIPYAELKNAVDRMSDPNTSPVTVVSSVPAAAAANNEKIIIPAAEQRILSFIYNNRQYSDAVFRYISPADFTGEFMQKLAGDIKNDPSGFEPAVYIDKYTDDKDRRGILCCIFSTDGTDPLIDDQISDPVRSACDDIKRIMVGALDRKIKECGDLAGYTSLKKQRDRILMSDVELVI